MAYVGQKPSQTLASPTSQYFNGDGSTVAFTLNRAVNVAEDLEVFVNNIQQEPGVGKSYTATGTTLTFDAAPSSGTANVYVVYRGLAEVTTRLEHDANAALAATTGTFSGDLTVDTNTLYVDSTNNRVGIGSTSPQGVLDLGDGTAGTGIVWGGPTGTAHYNSIWSEYGTASIVIGAGLKGSTSNSDFIFPFTGTYGYAAIELDSFSNEGIKFYTGGSVSRTSGASATKNERMRIDSDGRVTMPYQPAFDVASTAGVSGGNYQTFDTTYLNNGNHFSTSNNRFTAPIAGIYQFFATTIKSGSSTSNVSRVYVRVNGSNVRGNRHVRLSEGANYGTNGVGSWVLSLSANDYVQVYITDNGGSHSSVEYTYFNGYLIC